MASSLRGTSVSPSEGPVPALTVVVPTHGRAALVKNMLTSLEGARACTDGPVEVILVDSSSAEDGALIAQVCTEHNAVYLRGALSVRKKRNLGLTTAGAPVVLFLDSDCQADPDLFRQHLHAWRQAGPQVAGMTGLTRFVGEGSRYWKIMEHTSFLDAFSFATRFPALQWAVTNNLSVRKDVIKGIGGFDENLPYRLGWDDIDLGIRLTQAGYHIRSLPSAVVFHEKETWNSVGSQLSRLWRWGRIRFWILRKHPSLKRYDPIKPSTFMLFITLLLGIAAVAFRSFLPLLLLIGWLPLSCLAIAAFRTLLRKRPTSELFLTWAAESLMSIHDLATLAESLRQRSLLWVSHRLIFHDSQFAGEFQTELERFWGLITTFVLFGVVCWLLFRR